MAVPKIPQGIFSSTTRLTASDVAVIDEFVGLGLFPSRSRFVIESIRDLYIAITHKLSEFYKKIGPQDSLYLVSETCKKALKVIYLDDTGYSGRITEKPSIMVSINGEALFMHMAIETIEDKLELSDLQSVVSISVYLKIQEMKSYKNDTISNMEYMREVNERTLDRMPPDIVEQLLKDTGFERH